MCRYQIIQNKSITPAMLITEDGKTSIAPLMVGLWLLEILYIHQWLTANYYAVIEITTILRLAGRTAWAQTVRDITTPVVVAGIIIKAIWWGVTS